MGTELHCWGVKWSADTEVLEEAKGIDNPRKTLCIIDADFFPNIKQLIIIVCTFAIPLAICVIWRILWEVHTMVEERLNGLPMLYVHWDIDCCPEVVVDEFAWQYPRRLCLINPFTE